MKTSALLVLTLVCFTSWVMAGTKITAPNLKLGHWLVTVERSAVMDQAIAGLEGTDDEKAEAREMMEKFMPKTTSVDQCVTPDYLTDMEKAMNSPNSQGFGNDCKLDVLENTSKKMVVLTKCSESQITMKSTTHFINPNIMK